ncbi:helix-turn-helix domain-containing protein [bacterium]|nr:helix-turn-helix domain-containing protein [bacterium]
MNRTLFFRLIKNETCQTPIQYFINIKLDSARLILSTTTVRISEISSLLAFYDEFYFSKIFKKRFGITDESRSVSDICHVLNVQVCYLKPALSG